MIRLVNTHFNAAVMEVMALTGTPAVRTFTQNSQINAFLKRMQNPNRPVQSLPFSSFGIALSTISLPTISKFSLAVGPRVVNLTLRSKYEPTEKDYNPAWKTNEIQQFQIMEKLSALLSNVPNLRGLTMKFNNFILEDAQTALLPLTFRTLRNIFVGDLGHFEVVSAGKYLPTLIGTILERSPSVDFFSVCLAMPDFKSPRFALYELGRAMIQLVPMLFPDSDHPRPPPFLALSLELTILDVIALRDLVNEGFNKLRHLNLHLTNFHHVDEPFKELPVGAMIPVVTAFNQFMALQGESLETLRLSFNSTPNWDLQIQIILPSLTKLKKLRIHCYKYVNRDVKKLRPIRPFMTGQFPSLTDLELLTNRCDTGLINACHFPSVKTLRFTFLGGPPTPLPYAAIFPNLTLLQFGVTPPLATVEHILTEMPDLETLDLGEGFPGFGKGEALWKLYTGGVKPFAKNKFGQFLAQGVSHFFFDWRSIWNFTILFLILILRLQAELLVTVEEAAGMLDAPKVLPIWKVSLI